MPSHPEWTLEQWLQHIESIHPRGIEMGLDRVAEVYRRLGIMLACTKIVVGGTNGKGSTCAMLESILMAAGYRTACYTSPHLIDFNERARLDGQPVSEQDLLEHFEAVDAARTMSPPISLTYFEFTTLVFLRLFAERSAKGLLDVAILEIGLGGRLDAVNLVDADCSIVTSIDLDHQEFLGNTRDKIAWEKAHIYRSARPAICSDPMPPQTLVDHAESIGADLWLLGRDFNFQGDRQQWSWAGRGARRNALAFPALRGANQLLNASGVLAVLEALKPSLPVTAQAVRTGLATVELPGRFQVLAGKPTWVLDVAHNPHSVSVLAANLDSMGFFPYTAAIFGAMGDKDLDEMVRRVAPRIDHWLLVPLDGVRAASTERLKQALDNAGVVEAADRTIVQCSSVEDAMLKASSMIGDNDRLVVFGSFLTVAAVIKARRASRR